MMASKVVLADGAATCVIASLMIVYRGSNLYTAAGDESMHKTRLMGINLR